MNINDLNGATIVVTDLDMAISITDQYKDYRHEDKSFADCDEKQGRYWSDMHQKLVALKNSKTTI